MEGARGCLGDFEQEFDRVMFSLGCQKAVETCENTTGTPAIPDNFGTAQQMSFVIWVFWRMLPYTQSF